VWATPITLFGHAVARNPDSYIGHQNLSYELVQTGQLPRAIEHARRAVAISPHPPAWFHLGSLLGDQGQLDEAELYLRKTLEGNPRHARAHFVLGVIAERRNDRARAIQHFQTAVQLEPALAAEALGRLGAVAP
jgi:tetratricopeptide (TPR) repeat protein